MQEHPTVSLKIIYSELLVYFVVVITKSKLVSIVLSFLGDFKLV